MIGPVHWSEITPDEWSWPNFSPREMACRGGVRKGVVFAHPDLLDFLELLRARIGRPVIVTSAYRAPDWNVVKGGAENSQHIHGLAADVKVKGLGPSKLAHEIKWLARKIGWEDDIFVKVYSGHVHFDIRGRA